MNKLVVSLRTKNYPQSREAALNSTVRVEESITWTSSSTSPGLGKFTCEIGRANEKLLYWRLVK